MKKYSVLQDNLEECYICGTNQNIHIHHVFFGTANRKQSDKHNLVVALCMKHHTGSNNSVHRNKEIDLALKICGQLKFEEEHTRDEFRAIFGKSYL